MSHDTNHPPSHEDRLVRALSETSDGRTSLPQDLSECPDCRRQWNAMHTLDARLKNTRKEMEADLAAARALHEAPGLARIESAVELARGRALKSERTKRSPSALRFLALAASLAVLSWFGWRNGWFTTATKDHQFLGTSGLSAVEPLGSVQSVRRFAWLDEAAPASWYTLELQARASREAKWSTLTLPVTKLHALEWEPSDELRAIWPRLLRWRVTAFRSAGESFTSEWFDFELPPERR